MSIPTRIHHIANPLPHSLVIITTDNFPVIKSDTPAAEKD